MNDLGSGSNVDLCVITKDGVDNLRNYEYLQAKTYTRQFPVKYPTGTASGYTARDSEVPQLVAVSYHVASVVFLDGFGDGSGGKRATITRFGRCGLWLFREARLQ